MTNTLNTQNDEEPRRYLKKNAKIVVEALVDEDLRENLDLYLVDEEYESVAKMLNRHFEANKYIRCGFANVGDGSTTRIFYLIEPFPETLQEYIETPLRIIDSQKIKHMDKMSALKALELEFGSEYMEGIKTIVEKTCKTGHLRVMKDYRNVSNEARDTYIERDNMLAEIEMGYYTGKLSKQEYQEVRKGEEKFYAAVVARGEMLNVDFGVLDTLGNKILYFKGLLDDFEKFTTEYNDIFIKSQVEDKTADEVLERVSQFKKDCEKSMYGGEVKTNLNNLFKEKRGIEQDITMAETASREAVKRLKDFEKKNKEYKECKKALTGEFSKKTVGQTNIDESAIVPSYKKIIEDSKQSIAENKKLFEVQDKRYRQVKKNYEATEKRIEIYKTTAEKDKKATIEAEKVEIVEIKPESFSNS